MPHLSEISSPRDIKNLSIQELNQLALEIRQEILLVTGENGGHLSSNLGVVELTLALHFAYDAPEDKLLFDVGHQSYAHKLLTGRYGRFSTLREEGGLSGFTLRSESEYDAFGAGHSGTAVSAALGFARARLLNGQSYQVAAVVGDGSFMNGPNMEAVNDLGNSKLPVVVVLNDNEMSISKNVGGLSRYLNRLRTRPGYQQLKKSTKKSLDAIPFAGKGISAVLLAIKRLMRFLFVNGEFFSAIGFDYLGPVDGHDLEALILSLRAAKQMGRPVLLHVVTKKGKGFPPAEAESEKYHGVAPRVLDDDECFPYAAAAGQALRELGDMDEKVVAITAAMPEGTGSAIFQKAHPERFFDIGIAESHAVIQACAMAFAGLRPYFMVYSTFLQRGYDQILHDAALQNANITLLIGHAGLVGEDGCTHNGCFDLSYLLHIPNLSVLSPSSHEELAHLLFWAHEHLTNGPVAIRYAKAGKRSLGAVQNMDDRRWPILRKGEYAAVLAVGEMLRVALEAAEMLEEKGIHVSVYNARMLKPLPFEELAPLLERPVITIEENVLEGGFGSFVAMTAKEMNPKARVYSIGIRQGFLAHAKRSRQLALSGLDAASIAERICGFLGGVR